MPETRESAENAGKRKERQKCRKTKETAENAGKRKNRRKMPENERIGRECLRREENKNGRERQTGRRLYFCRKAEM